jgi:hypothetical protein
MVDGATVHQSVGHHVYQSLSKLQWRGLVQTTSGVEDGPGFHFVLDQYIITIGLCIFL